jgi:hypothetical protein
MTVKFLRIYMFSLVLTLCAAIVSVSAADKIIADYGGHSGRESCSCRGSDSEHEHEMQPRCIRRGLNSAVILPVALLEIGCS